PKINTVARGYRRLARTPIQWFTLLLFPSADGELNVGLTCQTRILVGGNEKLTALQFYSSRIAYRGRFNPLHRSGKLFQQYVLHAYCVVEAERLRFIRISGPDRLFSGCG